MIGPESLDKLSNHDIDDTFALVDIDAFEDASDDDTADELMCSRRDICSISSEIDMTTVAGLITAFHVNSQIWRSRSEIQPEKSRCILLQLCHGVYELAHNHSKNQIALGAAGVCASLASIISLPACRDPLLAEKALIAAKVLCRHCGEKSRTYTDNIRGLIEAGCCSGDVKCLYNYTSSQMTVEFNSFSKFDKIGIMTVIRTVGRSYLEVAVAGCSLISNLSVDFLSAKQLVTAGGVDGKYVATTPL